MERNGDRGYNATVRAKGNGQNIIRLKSKNHINTTRDALQTQCVIQIAQREDGVDDEQHLFVRPGYSRMPYLKAFMS